MREKETSNQNPNLQNRNDGLQNHDVVDLDGGDHPWMAACLRRDRDRRGQKVPLSILAIAIVRRKPMKSWECESDRPLLLDTEGNRERYSTKLTAAMAE